MPVNPIDRIVNALQKSGLVLLRDEIHDFDDLANQVEVACANHNVGRRQRDQENDYFGENVSIGETDGYPVE